MKMSVALLVFVNNQGTQDNVILTCNFKNTLRDQEKSDTEPLSVGSNHVY